MRLVVVSLLVISGLLLSLSAAATPHRSPKYPAEWQAVDLEVREDARTITADAGVSVDAGRRSENPTPTPTRPSKPIQLPSTYNDGYQSPAPVHYYEGESCSGDGYYEDSSSDGCSGSTYDSGDDGTVLYTGDDDDDDDTVYTGDDDDDTTTTPTDDDDDNGDVDIEWGDDDDDDTTASNLTPQSKKPTKRPSSPVSRLALLGALLAFPLRRRTRTSND